MNDLVLYEQFKDLSQKALDDALIDACLHNELDKVKYLLASPYIRKHANIHANDDGAFFAAYNNWHMNIVKYLSASEELKKHSNLGFFATTIFEIACENNDVNWIKGLLKFPYVHQQVKKTNYHIEAACYKGSLNAVQYFLETPEIAKDITISTYLLHESCKNGHLPLIKYLLESPNIKKHIDFHAEEDWAFQLSCGTENYELIKFYIFDLKIEKTNAIQRELAHATNNFMKNVADMFKMRELNQVLEKELDSAKIDKANSKKHKV